MLGIAKLQPSFDKSYLSLAVDVIVKPPCVSPCRDEHNHICVSAFLIAFLNPFRQLPAIWWIAEHHFAPQLWDSPSSSLVYLTFCAFCISLVILLAVCCLYSHGNWFFVAASASLFGLSVVFLPFAIKARPLRPWVEGHNKALLVLAVDGILFGNMMNVISLHQKGFGFTMLMAVLVAAALVLLIANVRMKGRNGNE